MRLKNTFLLLLTVISIQVVAQKGTITGLITDAESSALQPDDHDLSACRLKARS